VRKQIDIDIRKRIKEYIEIVEFLKKVGGNEELKVTQEYIFITRKRLEHLMQQFGNYDIPRSKLQIWKKLHWIEAPPNRLTNQIRVGEKRVQRVKIDRKIAEELIELGGKDYKEV
jgi:hypothetical protein